MTSQLYSGQAKKTLQITCPDTPKPRTSDQVEKRRSKRNTWNSSQTSVPNAIPLEEVQAASAKDKVLQTVIELCNTGRWHEINKYDVDQDALRQFQNVGDELTVNRQGNFLLRNTRIVMSKSLQARAGPLAHEGHQVTRKT